MKRTSQVDLAKRLGTTQQTVSRLVRGEQRPGPKLEKILERLGICSEGAWLTIDERRELARAEQQAAQHGA